GTHHNQHSFPPRRSSDLYGTVPVVHATGGLDDTVDEFDAATGTGTGFKFAPYAADALRAAMDRAVAVRRRPADWKRLVANGMARSEEHTSELQSLAYLVC